MSRSSVRRKPADGPVCLRPDKYARATRCGKSTQDVRWSEDRKRVTCPDCRTARR